MIAESGHYALVLALGLALIQSTVLMLGARLGLAAQAVAARPALLNFLNHSSETLPRREQL